MEANQITSKTKEEMAKAIEHLKVALSKIRAGKANPSMLDTVSVDYYGSPTKLSQVANITVVDARSLSIKPWEKTMLQEIEKGIFAANLGFTPQSDGENIRINIPALTEERRKDLAKQIRAEGETAKIGVRGARKNANVSIKKLGKEDLSEDQVKKYEGIVDDITKDYVGMVDKLIKAKEDEVTSM